ncbi:hypothetical protein ACIRBZ_11515 [Streptomyces sp. NPDC094038]|uniref:hypothetical protein n=1 Tax=Streptomyces sp. NPDC094038 TaxID=3366055 RepID=UPI00382E29CD
MTRTPPSSVPHRPATSGRPTCSWRTSCPSSATSSGPDLRQGHSAILSPGFNKYDADAPVVPRDLDRFRRDATTVATSGAPFQLLVTYNEWGEGTAAESATAWASPSGHGAYMDVLRDVLTAHPR